MIVDELAGHVGLLRDGPDRGSSHSVTLEELTGGRGDVAARSREPARLIQVLSMGANMRGSFAR